MSQGIRIYVGNLNEECTVSELEKEFEYFGRVKDVWVAKNPPGFGFMVFEDTRDGEDAIREMDGRTFKGKKLRVEESNRRPGASGGGGGRGRDIDCYNCHERGHVSRDCPRGGGRGCRSRSRSFSPRRRSFSPQRKRQPPPVGDGTRIYIGGLPDDCTVNELEREFEYFGCCRDVWVARNPPGFGFMVFDDDRDAQDAIREMDGRSFKGRKIRVEESKGPRRNGGGGGGGGRGTECYNCHETGHFSRDCPRKRGSRSRSGSRRRSRSSSRKRSMSRSVSPRHR